MPHLVQVCSSVYYTKPTHSDHSRNILIIRKILIKKDLCSSRYQMVIRWQTTSTHYYFLLCSRKLITHARDSALHCSRKLTLETSFHCINPFWASYVLLLCIKFGCIALQMHHSICTVHYKKHWCDRSAFLVNWTPVCVALEWLHLLGGFRQ